MERTVSLVRQWDETFDIGADTGTRWMTKTIRTRSS